MKKRQLIWIGLIGVIMASCGGKYKITGKTNLIPDGETILLQKQNNEQFEIVDSATVTNGSFSFKGEQKSPTIAILVTFERQTITNSTSTDSVGKGRYLCYARFCLSYIRDAVERQIADV